MSPRGDGSGELSLEDQVVKAKQYAELYGIAVVEVIRDKHESAKTLERPGLRTALERLRSGAADTIIVAKLDRLTRSVRGLGELLEQFFTEGGYSLCSVAEQIDTRSASGRLVANVLASVAQWEREAIAERTTAALAVKKRRGEQVGQIPYGWRRGENGKLISDPVESKIVEYIQRLHAGGASIRAIVREMNEAGVPARGKRWHITSVSRILSKEVLTEAQIGMGTSF